VKYVALKYTLCTPGCFNIDGLAFVNPSFACDFSKEIGQIDSLKFLNYSIILYFVNAEGKPV